jgi:hypothetical protein
MRKGRITRFKQLDNLFTKPEKVIISQSIIGKFLRRAYGTSPPFLAYESVYSRVQLNVINGIENPLCY